MAARCWLIEEVAELSWIHRSKWFMITVVMVYLRLWNFGASEANICIARYGGRRTRTPESDGSGSRFLPCLLTSWERLLDFSDPQEFLQLKRGWAVTVTLGFWSPDSQQWLQQKPPQCAGLLLALFFQILPTEPKALCVLGEYSTTDLSVPRPLLPSYFKTGFQWIIQVDLELIL